MKTPLFSLFLLSIFTTLLPSPIVGVVLDTDGEVLQNGGTYYILPVFRGKGGGLGLARTGNETCPLTVVQSRSEVSNGLPVRISSPARIAFIGEGLPLHIAFTVVPLCATTPSQWIVVEEPPKGLSVKITGYKNPVQGTFSIEKYHSDYKLVFYAFSSETNGDIGIYIDGDRNRRLVVTDEEYPFVVQFKKVNRDLSIV